MCPAYMWRNCGNSTNLCRKGPEGSGTGKPNALRQHKPATVIQGDGKNDNEDDDADVAHSR